MVINVNKKIFAIFLVFLIIAVSAFFIWRYTHSENNTSNYESCKTSANNTSSNNEISGEKASSESSNSVNNATNSNTSNEIKDNGAVPESPPSTNPTSPVPQVKEEILSTFSTKIYSNDTSRQNNINITCSTLNGTVVKNGATFSFCNTIGPSNSSKGYQEADIFDKNGNKKKGLGGGNCQVSTTLYNAVLAVPSLTVTERHEHSNHVPYIEEGKDAAVAYGSYDLKFVNNSGNDIKITAATDASAISISIVALKA